jgi:hypothetical protein
MHMLFMKSFWISTLSDRSGATGASDPVLLFFSLFFFKRSPGSTPVLDEYNNERKEHAEHGEPLPLLVAASSTVPVPAK